MKGRIGETNPQVQQCKHRDYDIFSNITKETGRKIYCEAKKTLMSNPYLQAKSSATGKTTCSLKSNSGEIWGDHDGRKDPIVIPVRELS